MMIPLHQRELVVHVRAAGVSAGWSEFSNIRGNSGIGRRNIAGSRSVEAWQKTLLTPPLLLLLFADLVANSIKTLQTIGLEIAGEL